MAAADLRKLASLQQAHSTNPLPSSAKGQFISDQSGF